MVLDGLFDGIQDVKDAFDCDDDVNAKAILPVNADNNNNNNSNKPGPYSYTKTLWKQKFLFNDGNLSLSVEW